MTDDTHTTFGKQDVEDGIEGEWELVRSWQSFLDFFEDAVHIDAVTYCESPGLIRDLFSESSEIPTVVESVDILIGNRSEYRTALDDVDTAHRLSELYREGKLTIRLKNRREVHSKLYRIVKPDEVVLLHGSANFSYHAWKNQSNSFTVWRTRRGLAPSAVRNDVRPAVVSFEVYRLLADELVQVLERNFGYVHDAAF